MEKNSGRGRRLLSLLSIVESVRRYWFPFSSDAGLLSSWLHEQNVNK